MTKKKIKALGLLSGGLDSTVAARLLQEQGVEVAGVNFSTGFCVSDHHRALRKKSVPEHKLKNEALRAGADLGAGIEIVDISKSYFRDVVLKPKYGYGAGMNPCLDCRLYMLKKAKRMMKKTGADFVFTGEVLGQRPMSQYRRALDILAKESGLGDRLVRPLSAQKLPETLPEKMGWIKRESLKGIEGRTRTEQIKLAGELGVLDYPQPAGGCCYLPDPVFATKLRDLIRHQKRLNKTDLLLLKVGRHFRLSDNAKLIVGREEAENNFLERFRRGRTLIKVVETHGPSALLSGSYEKTERDLALRIVARYADPNPSGSIKMTVSRGRKESVREATPLEPESIEPLRVGVKV